MALVNIPNDHARSVSIDKEFRKKHPEVYKTFSRDFGKEVGDSMSAYLDARYSTKPKKIRQDLVEELKSYENALTSTKRDVYTIDYINRCIFDLKNDIQTGNHATSVEDIQYNLDYKQTQKDYYYSEEYMQVKTQFEQKVLQKCQELFLM